MTNQGGTAQDENLNSGSKWHRWEPHIHAPGTVLNDQYSGPDAWNRYLNALENSSPVIRAIAVTDYYTTDSYEYVCQQKLAGRLPAIDLIFPNVEVRLDIATVKGNWVNLHLLVSPEDSNHVEEVKRILSRLRFPAFSDTFDCTRADLIRLGKRSNPNIVDDNAALAHGASQFKVNLADLREVFNGSQWAKDNILIAVAGAMGDGTSGVREASDTTLRQEIEKFAHVIFASSSAQREFWLGQRDLTAAQITERYNGLKPCLHGSDAHSHVTVGAPQDDRYSWVKGGLEFDALRQACIDPGGRAFVGVEPPQSATQSQVITKIEIANAPWAQIPAIALNPGLVAIIGARGSGKTALADMIAAGCDAISEEAWIEAKGVSPSFLVRAKDLIGNAKVKLSWGAGLDIERALDGTDAFDALAYPRARYLSQQFVEELCSSSGMTDALLAEIERIIFESHTLIERDGAVDFNELLELRASRFRQARKREEEALEIISDRIGIELEKEKLVSAYQAQVTQKTNLIAAYTADRAKLVSAGSEQRVARLAGLSTAADKVRAQLRAYSNQEQAFLGLQDEVGDVRKNQAPDSLRRTQERYPASGMNETQWSPFLMDYKGDVDTAISGYLEYSRRTAANLKGIAPTSIDPSLPLIAEDADLTKIPLATLDAEIGRLQGLISSDQNTARQYGALSAKITEETAALTRLNEKLTDCVGARGRASTLLQDRESAYSRVFDAIISEQAVLTELYRPLMTRLTTGSPTLRKMSFSVSRVVDVSAWAEEAEENLLDLRRQGTFRGKGTLTQRANEALKPAWEIGDSSLISQKMSLFRQAYQQALLEHSPVPKTDQADFRAWSKRFAKWLFSTSHIQIAYGIEYDGIDIRKLSPGTRGIVLLLLYLALDDADDRPLIIDQPEENLDPKSVFDELVGLFIDAKKKRQVIMVTHNANLVINTDADQIIVAECGPHRHGELPPITYTSGGLENAGIRKAVCDILEGGESAFKERARRLRVRLER